MKVKNVSRVENNTENYSAGLEKDLSSKGQSSSKSNTSAESVVDIVDINANSEFDGTAEGEIPSDKANTKNEAVFYGKQNPTVKDGDAGKNSIQSDVRNEADAEGDLHNKEMQGKMLYGKNEYSKTINSASSNLNGIGREYGNPKQLNTISNPQIADAKNTFYNGRRSTVMIDGMITDSDKLFLGAEKSGPDGAFGGRVNLVANGANMSVNPVDRQNANMDFGRGNAATSIGNGDGYETAGNMNSGAEEGTVNSGVSRNEMNALLGNRNNAQGTYDSEMADIPDNAGSVRLGNAGQQIRENGSGGRTIVLSNGDRIGYAKNADADSIVSGNEKGSAQNTYTSDVSSGDNTLQKGGYILGRNTTVSVSAEDAQTVNGRYGERNIFDKTSGISEDVRNVISGDSRRIEIRRRNVDKQEYISAQMAYQTIIQRNITDIYKASPELDKLIMLLFRVRKLTVKKIENNSSGVFERRSVEEEVRLMLEEARNLIEREGYKKGKVINLLNQFQDDQEKLKACVGLSPFPIDIKDFEEFYEGVKDEVADIRDYIEEERRKDIWKSIFRIFVLAFFVVILYILFLR